jgi:putative Mg2+ transporter-C (MgtC) family protein
MAPLTATEVAIRLTAALLAGALVGLERERKHRPAGFRTMILISLGSCGFVVAGLSALSAFPESGQAEVSRILQGLMSGVGFLGAGAVIQNKKAVRGLTTAAAVWVTSALGAMCGVGQFMTAGMLAAFTLFTLLVLEHVEERYFPEPDFDNPDPGANAAEPKGENSRHTAERKSPPGA